MRIYLTGASGFVGSNLAHVFAHQHGAEVVAPAHVVLISSDWVFDGTQGAGGGAKESELPDLTGMLGRLGVEVESTWSLA